MGEIGLLNLKFKKGSKRGKNCGESVKNSVNLQGNIGFGGRVGGTGGRVRYRGSFDGGRRGGEGGGEIGEQMEGYLRRKFGETFERFDVGGGREGLGVGSVKNSSDGFGFWGVGEGRFLDVGEGNFLGTSRLKDECLRQENRMNQLFKGDIKAKLERYKQI